MNKAVFIKGEVGPNGQEQHFYKVDPPMESRSWYKGDKIKKFDYVMVSAAVVPFGGPETYIFGCDEEGTVLDWGELKGSYQGGLSHEEALDGAGYKIVDN